MAQLRGQTALTNEATILALLVCWALQQEQAHWAGAVLSQAQEQVLNSAAAAPESEPAQQHSAERQEAAVSSWVLTALCIQTLRVVVQGYWTPARLQVCLPHLRRFVCGSPRLRQQQESTIRRSLTTQLAARLPTSSPMVLAASP